MQALHLGEHLGALGLAEVGQAPGLAVERGVPVDAPAGRLDFGDRQQVGVLARQALGDGRAQLPGGPPHRIAGHAERAIALQRLTAQERTRHHVTARRADRTWRRSIGCPTSLLLR